MPWATITQTFPARLHSMQTEWLATAGLRSLRKALITSSSWWRLTGQPCSSKSTWTLAEIGVEVSSVEMYSGEA